MKAEEIIKRSSIPFHLKNLSAEDFEPLRAKLKAAQYNEKTILERLQINEFDEILVSHLPIFLNFRLRESKPIDVLIKLFLLAQRLPRDEVGIVFNDYEIDLYADIGLFKKDGDIVFSRIDIFPCLGYFFVTDHAITEFTLSRQVMYLGRDSYCLARGTFRDKVKKTLDLCTGCGVHAILARRHSEKVIGVDINDRALKFAKINCLLNNVDGVEFRQGDLYEPAQGEKFDLILANPPFVPSPEKMLLFREGSSSGEEILKRIIMGAPRFLSRGGICQIVTLLVFITGENYLDKILKWLGGRNYDLLVLANRYHEIEQYIIGHVKFLRTFGEYNMQLTQWLECYRKNRIERVADGMITFAETENGEIGNHRLKDIKLLTSSFEKRYKKAFDLMKKTRTPGFDKKVLKSKLQINRGINLFWSGKYLDGRDIAGTQFKADDWNQDQFIPIEAHEILAQCQNPTACKELLQKLAARKSIAKKTAYQKYLPIIKEMIEHELIEFE